MFALISGILWRAAMMAGLALALANGAAAATKNLNGTYSRTDLRASCDTAGGTYVENGGGSTGTQPTYACVTGKGIVNCQDNGKCSGTCAKCADVLPKKGGVVGGAGSAGNASGTNHAHATSSHKVKPIVAVHHAPLKKFAARTSRVH
jgi:hypothetical protein